MKIIYITSSFPFGNSESFLLNEVESLINHGLDIIVIPINPKGNLRLDIKKIDQKHFSILYEKLFSYNVLCSFINSLFNRNLFFLKIIKLIIKNPKHIAKNIAILPKSYWLKQQIHKINPDHIHVHWGSTSSSAVLFATLDTAFTWSLTCHRWDIYDNNLLAIKSKKSKFIRFISQKGKNDSLKFGVSKEKSTVIYFGTKIPIISIKNLSHQVEELTILCPANLIPVKGHIYLLEAIKKLLFKKLNIKLLLAGDGELKNELESYVNNNNLDDNIKFLGHLSHGKLISMYENRKIDLVVLPSIDLGRGEHEGIPVALMEAMSYAIPVLSTNTGSINELLPIEIGLTIRDKDSIELSKQIELFYRDKNKLIEKGNLCRQIIEDEWNISHSTSKLIDMFFDKQQQK